MTNRRFDKRLFEAGSQCAKRLYLEMHEPRSIPGLSEDRQLLVDVGLRLVELASQAFPGGQTVADDDHEEAARETAEILDKQDRAIVFGAAFHNDHAETRTDILLGEGKDDEGRQKVSIFEVKAGTTIKPRHLSDIALQILVIEDAGFVVHTATILHLDPKYQHTGGPKFPIKLFKSNDVTDRARRQVDRVRERLRSFQTLAEDEASLDLPTGTWCRRPLPCAFLDRCRAEGPPRPLIELPRLTREQEFRLHEQGIEELTSLNKRNLRLSGQQRRALRAIQSEDTVVEEFVAGELNDVDWPVHFLDILWCVEVLPRFPKTRPWEQLPFHWTARVLHKDGRVERRCFTSTTADDPREEVVRRLVWTAREAGTLLVWDSPHEERLRAFLDQIPKLKSELRGILNLPVFDLCHLIQHGVYHPSFEGRFDLRTVHDALVDDRSRDKLAIATPEDAAMAFRRLLNSRTRTQTREKLGTQIEDYGDWRTSAMMRLYEMLRLKPATAETS